MQAVANNPKFANKVGVKQSIGHEFTKENSMKKKMNMGGRAMKDRDGSVAMDPRMQMAMAEQQRKAAVGGMKYGGKVKMRSGGPTARTKHIMNEKDEIRRVDREIRENEGYKKGGSIKDKEGRALAKNKKGMSKSKMADARGRAMKSTKTTKAKTGGSKAKMTAKGKQGYNARLDESLGMRKGKASTKSQSYKSRRDESKGAKKAAGKRAYSGNKSSAQGRGNASKRADGIARKGHTRGRHV